MLILAHDRSTKLRLSAKINSEYANAKVLPAALVAQQQGGIGPQRPGQAKPAAPQRKMIEGKQMGRRERGRQSDEMGWRGADLTTGLIH